MMTINFVVVSFLSAPLFLLLVYVYITVGQSWQLRILLFQRPCEESWISIYRLHWPYVDLRIVDLPEVVLKIFTAA